MKPRRAQEDHAHPEIVLGGGGSAGLQRSVYPNPSGGVDVYAGTITPTVYRPSGTVGDCTVDLTGSDPKARRRSGVLVTRTRAGWVIPSQWLSRAAGFQTRIMFGLDDTTDWNTRTTLMCGVFASVPTTVDELSASSPHGVGLCIDYDDTDISDSGSGPQPFKWVSNDGSTCEKSAVGMSFTAGHSYSLVVTAAPGAGELSAKLTDLGTGASSSHTFSTTPSASTLLGPLLLAGWWDGPGRSFPAPGPALMTGTLETSAGVYDSPTGFNGSVTLDLDVYPYVYEHNNTSVTYTTWVSFAALSPYTRPIPPGVYPSYTFPYPSGAVNTYRDTLGTFPNAGGSTGGNVSGHGGPPFFGGTGTPKDDIVVADTAPTPDVELIRAYAWHAPRLLFMGFDAWELVDDGWPG